MRRFTAAILVAALVTLLSLAMISAQDGRQIDVPGIPPVVILNPDAHARLAVQHLSTADGDLGHHAFTQTEWCYIRYLSLYALPDEMVDDVAKIMAVWVNELSFEAGRSRPRPVPGSRNRLWWLDTRDYHWNAQGFESVAEREPYCQEPWISHEHAEFLRRAAGVRNSRKALNKQVFHAQGMVRGDWLVRETMESDRSPSYYDLLFCSQRYPGAGKVKQIRKIERVPETYIDREDWPGGVDPRDGKYYPAGKYKVERTRYKDVERILDVEQDDFVDFPKDVDEWDSAFGIDKIRAFAREQKVDLDFGSILEGGADVPKDGSIVSLHNRLIVTYKGPLGAASRTYDVFETSGDRDYTEKLIFKGGKFKKGNGADAVFDAGELLYYLANGGQAGFLIDGKGKRAEIAATKAANASHDKLPNPGVRNVGDCFMCHARAGGYIMPANFLTDFEELGGELRFKDRERRNRIRGFMQGWQGQIAGFRKPYEELIAEMTQETNKDGKVIKPGWTGAEFAAKLQTFRNWYDAPLDLKQCLREVGVPEDVYRVIARKTGDYRPQSLLKGKVIPRKVWETDVFPKLQVIRQAMTDEARYLEKQQPAR